VVELSSRVCPKSIRSPVIGPNGSHSRCPDMVVRDGFVESPALAVIWLEKVFIRGRHISPYQLALCDCYT